MKTNCCDVMLCCVCDVFMMSVAICQNKGPFKLARIATEQVITSERANRSQIAMLFVNFIIYKLVL